MTGELEEAVELASIDAAPVRPASVRWRAETVIGIVAGLRGEMKTAERQFQMALRSAVESGISEAIAWAYLYLFRHMIEGHPLDALMATLSDVRRAVTRAAAPQASAYLHQCVSVLEGHTGRFDEARRHCDIADSILTLTPNISLSAGGHLNRGCIEIFGCNFKQAARFTEDARRTAAKAGHARAMAVSENNLGYIQLLTGQFEKARHSLERVRRSTTAPRFALFGALDGLARICLALGELDDCRKWLSDIEAQIGQQGDLTTVYHVRWAAITKARLFLRLGDGRAALELLNQLQRRSQDLGDTDFRAALDVAIAEAHFLQGDLAESATHLFNADQLAITTVRQLLGTYYYSASRIVRRADPLLGSQLRRRAMNVWDEQGVVSIPLEIGQFDDKTTARPTKNTTTFSDATSGVSLRLANSLAALFDLAHSPSLLAKEMTAALEALDVVTGVRVIEASRDRDSPHRENKASLELGTRFNRSIRVTCDLPTDPQAAILVGDVFKIAGAAIALERARREERSRAAVWPANPIEEQAGAFFLAEEMQGLLRTARRIASTNVPVLITGETGTGKEVLARTIHAYSPRANATFLPFNCSAVPKDMLDPQLFGHRRGAFTGAVESLPGVIRSATGGTLFLDEIGEMTMEVQPKLLRFLESNEVHPIGEAQPQRVDVRIVAATNASLDGLMAAGRFREDLFYRLNIVHLHLPPLRERRVEIPTFANHYLQKFALEWRKGDLRLAEETMEYLVLYRWPGNVRQLANEMRRLAALAEPGAIMMPEHLSPDIAASRRTISPSERQLEATEIAVRIDQPMNAAVQHLERAMIQYALKQSGGRLEDTAALLGLSRKGLYLKRMRFGLAEADAAPHVDVA